MFRVRFFDKEEVDNNQLKITNLIRSKIENHPKIDKIKTPTNVKDYANDALYDYIILQQKSIKNTSEKLQEIIEQIDHQHTDLNLNKCLELFKSFSIQKDIYFDVMTELEEQYKFLDKFVSVNKKNFAADIYFQFRLLKHTLYRNIIQKPLLDSLAFKMGSAITSEENIASLYENALIDNKKDLKVFDIGKFKSVANFLAGKNDNINDETANIIIGLFNIDLSNEFPFPELEPITPEQKLIENLKHIYTTDNDFTQIRNFGISHDDFPTLSMEDYYMDLSYLNKQDMNSRDTYLENEQESFQEKITRNKLPHNYISESILLNHNRIVIIGNPGCGKSTFSRWLCYNWAKKGESDQMIPIFIDLKEFVVGEKYDITKYIAELFNLKEEYINGILTSTNLKFRLILDGLDEITDTNKNKLHHNIRSLNPELEDSYILLCRPYALSQNKFGQISPTIEIIGYNDSSRYHYIKNVLSQHPDGINQKKKLEDLLQSNTVLCDLSYNPQLLSMIVSSFFCKKNKQDLNKIETTYDVYNWTLNRIINNAYTRGDINIEDWHKNTLNLSEFAYVMMMNKTIIYSGEILDKYMSTAKFLSLCGLGKFELYGDTNWQFHFHSITTQEFFTSQYLKNELTINTTLFLLRDPFYLNVILFYIGSDTLNVKHISKLGKLIPSNNKSDYFAILGELGTEKLNLIINKKVLRQLIQSIKHIEDSSILSLKLIFNKLNSPNKKLFINCVLKSYKLEFINFIRGRSNQIYFFSEVDYIFDIILETNLLNHENFLKDYLSYAMNLFKSNRLEDSFLLDSILFILSFLNKNPSFINKNNLLKIKSELEELQDSETISAGTLINIDEILIRISPSNKHIKEINELILELPTRKKVIEDDSTTFSDLSFITEKCNDLSLSCSYETVEIKSKAKVLIHSCLELINRYQFSIPNLKYKLISELNIANAQLKLFHKEIDLQYIQYYDSNYYEYSLKEMDILLGNCYLLKEKELFTQLYGEILKSSFLPIKYLNNYFDIIYLAIKSNLLSSNNHQDNPPKYHFYNINNIDPLQHIEAWERISSSYKDIFVSKLYQHKLFSTLYEISLNYPVFLFIITHNTYYKLNSIYNTLEIMASSPLQNIDLWGTLMNSKIYAYDSNFEYILKIWIKISSCLDVDKIHESSIHIQYILISITNILREIYRKKIKTKNYNIIDTAQELNKAILKKLLKYNSHNNSEEVFTLSCYCQCNQILLNTLQETIENQIVYCDKNNMISYILNQNFSYKELLGLKPYLEKKFYTSLINTSNPNNFDLIQFEQMLASGKIGKANYHLVINRIRNYFKS